MASLKKFFKNIKNEHILAIIGLVFLVYALHQYSQNKNMFKLGMINNEQSINSSLPSNPSTSPAPNKPTPKANTGAVQPSQPTTNKMAGSLLNSSDNISSFADKQSSASNLLPSGNNNNIERFVNDVVKPESTPPNRNASLDLRTDPVIPRNNEKVCPWLNSTISRPPDYKTLGISSN